MQTEYEAKFCAVDHDEIRKHLKAAGATLEQPMRLMRRQIFDYPDHQLKTKDAFIRLRDEGHKISLTYKQFPGEHSVDSAREIEIEVSDFAKAGELLEAVGLVSHSFQESRRETWTLDGVEIVLDEWPWLKPYIEIEASNEADVKAMASKLGFDWKDAVFGDVVVAYRLEYTFPKGRLGTNPRVLFDDPRPDWMIPK